MSRRSFGWNKLGKPEKLMAVNVIAFVSVLLLGGELSLLVPGQEVSAYEKRPLTPMPAFTPESLFLGHFTDSLDLHYSDNFPFRDGWVAFSARLRDDFGYRPNDLAVYAVADEYASLEDIAAKADSVVARVDSTAKPVAKDSVKRPLHKPGTILIYNGMAFQIFTSSRTRSEKYADLVNLYRKTLPDSVRIFSLIAPTSSDFYLPIENKESRNLEGPMVRQVRDNLDSGVVDVPAYEEISRHTDEYLYFHTDHHWTARGAYYAYRAFCKSAGLTPTSLTEYRRRVRKHYLGSLYGMTQDVRLLDHEDSVETFRLPIQTRIIRFKTPELMDSAQANLFVETANYTTFLGGDYPLIRVESAAATDQVALVIKDSYGNAVCPFLAMHYRRIFVIDYRTFDKNIQAFIRTNGVNDVIFIHNTFAANADFTVKKEAYLLHKRDVVPEIPAPDTTTVKTVEDKEGNGKMLH